jgi:transcription initiation factor TFIIF subunit alpha
MKKKHVSSSQPTGTSTPSGSRAMSPSASQPTPGGHQRRSSIVTLPVESSKLSQILSSTPHPSAVASDGEATAGETSDGAPKKKKLGLKIGGGARLSPSGSRAGSPAAGSRAGSPAAAPAEAQSPAAAAEVRLVTREEVMAALRPEGITIGELLGKFTGRVNGGKPKEHFMQLVKNLAAFGADKKLRPKK